MSLLQRAQTAYESLHSLESAKTLHDEARQIQGLRSELALAVQRMMDVVERTEALLTQDVPVPPIGPDKTLKQVRNLRETLARGTSPTELRRGHLWTNTVKAIQTYAEVCEKAQNDAWKDFLEQLFHGESPEDIRGRMAMTPENQEAYDKYKIAFQRKQSLVRSTPTAENAQEANKVVAIMHEAYRALDFNVPAEVKRFLNDAVSQQGAPLTALTPTVVDWLQEKDMFDHYTVRHRR
jgi:hypothetical protein